jgi:hypothetical protein
MPKKYEYLTASYLNPFANNSGVAQQGREKLAALGSEGWQIVNTQQIQGGNYQALLMREVVEPEAQ